MSLDFCKIDVGLPMSDPKRFIRHAATVNSQAARRRRKHRNPLIGQEKFLLLASSCFAGKVEVQDLEMRRVHGVRRCDVTLQKQDLNRYGPQLQTGLQYQRTCRHLALSPVWEAVFYNVWQQ